MLAGSSYFTTLDLASGYWQVEVEERDKHFPQQVAIMNLM